MRLQAHARLRHAGLGPLQATAPESWTGWPGVVRYALENWPRTVRLCVIAIVVGAVLLLAIRLRFRFCFWP
jgi:hypothetical protein